MRIAVLITCYNRVAVTLKGLAALKHALDDVEDLQYRIFLLDDASPDGTGNAVRLAFPDVEVVEGSGSLYWVRGVGKAYEAARRSGAFDAYLLFNDDVIVDPEGVHAFFEDYREANSRRPSIVGGATLSSDRSVVTYCGSRKTSVLRPRAGERVLPNGTLQAMDMPNGNFLLTPGPFFESVGGLDPAYTMGYADVDLGLTARKHGLDVFLARKAIGTCDENPFLHNLRAGSIYERWKISRRPIFWFSAYSHFVLKHAPWILYPVYVFIFFLGRIKLLIAP